MTRVLLLCKSDYLARKISYCLDAAGVELDLLTGQWSPLSFSRYVRKSTTVDFPSTSVPSAKFIESVNRYIADNAIDCVLAADIELELLLYNMRSTLSGAACFPLSANTTISLLDNKYQLNSFMVEQGLPAPRSVLVGTRESVFASDLRQMSYPVIAKPINMDAGQGVFLAEHFEQLADHIYGDAPYSDPPKLVQEFVPGLDAGCSVLAQRGEILTWAQQCYAEDGTIEFYHDDELLGVVRTIVKHLDFSGVANFDVRIDEKFKLLAVIECNPRFWFSIPAAMVHGLNFVKAGIDLALGQTPEPKMQQGYRAGTYIPVRAAIKLNAGRLLAEKVALHPENWRELRREVTDILPNLYMYAQRLLDRR